MNLSTISGFIASALVFGLALMETSTDWHVFLNPHAILIVLGGTLAASAICFPVDRLIGLMRVFLRRILGRNRRNYQDILNEIVLLSQASRKGRQSLEGFVETIRDPFLKDAAEMLFWNERELPSRELRHLLETRVETMYDRYLKEADIFRVMSRFPPAFGLMGTTLGMIVLLQGIGKGGSASIGPAMSVALVATLYGILLANFIFIPIAENLIEQSREELTARRMVVEGVVLIARGKPTIHVEEMVRSFLLPSERGPHRGYEPSDSARMGEAA